MGFLWILRDAFVDMLHDIKKCRFTQRKAWSKMDMKSNLERHCGKGVNENVQFYPGKPSGLPKASQLL